MPKGQKRVQREEKETPAVSQPAKKQKTNAGSAPPMWMKNAGVLRFAQFDFNALACQVFQKIPGLATVAPLDVRTLKVTFKSPKATKDALAAGKFEVSHAGHDFVITVKDTHNGTSGVFFELPLAKLLRFVLQAGLGKSININLVQADGCWVRIKGSKFQEAFTVGSVKIACPKKEVGDNEKDFIQAWAAANQGKQ
eukprot:NODE_4390_length_815_cov_41.988251_g4060_i0.p2 GENE.NODE_4390_length_815_cov_41.988251_g4060_i0~~NODE_4390_length_815_cov_41.988251_g4060_i0.p2  ORF type:complete len:215 (+),score=59.47 NODE_4390_length_815_cov_41.988251_g4060_i0:59-646(+)